MTTWVLPEVHAVKCSQGREAKTRKLVESNYARNGPASALRPRLQPLVPKLNVMNYGSP